MDMHTSSNDVVRIVGRVIVGGLVAALVWYIGLLLVFSPAQQVLANPEYQSQKFLEVFTALKPMPKMYVETVAFYIGFLFVGMAFSWAYHLVGRWMSGKSLKKGLLFGFIAWLIMNPWFEFYLPWNVMHEPIALVLLEMTLWLVVILMVSVATVFTHDFLESRKL